MKELENVMSQLEKETKKKEQAENKIKQLRQKKSQLKRKADTKRKVEKGGVFEKFEKQITGVEENTDNDLIYAFLDYVLSDNRNREKLKELTEIHLREKEISLEENPNLKEENANDDFEELTEEEYTRLKNVLTIATEKMLDCADLFVLLTQVVNDLYTIILLI